MANLYTAGQVDDTLLRAQVAMYLISEEIGAKFYYLNVPIYNNYKDLQYDIYTLYQVIIEAKQFVTYNPIATLFEDDFYMLVGALINKVKQVDVYGAFGGTVNPNYQNPAIIININESGAEVESYVYTQDDLIDADPPNGAWYLPFETPDGQSLDGKTPIMVAINGTSFTFQFDNLTQRIYGFANNDTQTITVTVI